MFISSANFAFLSFDAFEPEMRFSDERLTGPSSLGAQKAEWKFRARIDEAAEHFSPEKGAPGSKRTGEGDFGFGTH